MPSGRGGQVAEVLPSTFESRGILVGFQHRLLRHVRLRVPDKAGFKLRDVEAVIQNYSGTSNKHMLVLPWQHLPNLAKPGNRDQKLFDAVTQVERLDTMDPLMMRTLVIEVDRADDENPVNQARAKAEMEAVRMDRFRTYLSFLVQLARECGEEEDDAELRQIDLPKVMAAIRQEGLNTSDPGTFSARLYRFLGRRVRINQSELVRRIEQLTDLAAPFGSICLDEVVGVEGYLFRSAKRLKTFRTQISSHEKMSTEEIANNCLLIIFAIKTYLDYIENKRLQLALRFRSFTGLVDQFEEGSTLLRRFRRNAAFALDGWTPLIDLWDQAWEQKAEAGKLAVDRAVFEILQFLPLMPNAELDSGDENKRIWKRYQFMRAKPIPQMYSWLDEKPDTELMQRVEAGRTRMASEGRRAGNDSTIKYPRR